MVYVQIYDFNGNPTIKCYKDILSSVTKINIMTTKNSISHLKSISTVSGKTMTAMQNSWDESHDAHLRLFGLRAY